MTDDLQLRHAVIELLEIVKHERIAFAYLLAEVAAIRESLIQIEPRYDDVLTPQRARHRQAAEQAVFADLRTLDNLIQQLKRV